MTAPHLVLSMLRHLGIHNDFNIISVDGLCGKEQFQDGMVNDSEEIN